MEKVDNPELTRLILDHLADLYNIKRQRQGIHLSTLVYCITRAYFDFKIFLEPTDEEVMLFSLGYGLQDILTPKDAEAPVIEQDGIIFSPDFVLKVGEARVAELKTTRMSTKRDFPETWLQYIMGGCFITQVKTYNLSVLHMLGNYAPPFPQLRSYTLKFTEDELLDNWSYLQERKAVLEGALEDNLPPKPFQYCKEWECKNCRYKMHCDALSFSKEESK